jgi:hypothetical protein
LSGASLSNQDGDALARLSPDENNGTGAWFEMCARASLDAVKQPINAVSLKTAQEGRMSKSVCLTVFTVARSERGGAGSGAEKKVARRIGALVAAGVLSLTAFAPLPALANRSCAEARRLHSLNSENPTTITFNDSPAPRSIWWIDFDGGQKSYGEVDPGEQKTIETFLTHPWVVSNETGACVKVVVPQPGGSMIRIAH